MFFLIKYVNATTTAGDAADSSAGTGEKKSANVSPELVKILHDPKWRR
jgi:hypothetical protein